MASYQSLTEFVKLSLIPADYIAELEATQPGWVQAQLDYWSRWIDTQLRKRYAVPFTAPVPEAVQGWINRLVTMRVLLRRGIDPTDAQFAEIKADSDSAREEIKEAATSGENVFELPLRADLPAASGVTRMGTLSYSEQSPYVWTSKQREAARDEDSNGDGSRS
jgi:hypothetical protein